MAYGLGAVVSERFRLERILGRGGMAIVYEAEDLTSGERIAIKMLEDEIRHDPEVVERFGREGRAMQEVQSAFVARAHGRGIAANGTPFLAMERLDGKDLGAVLRKRDRLPFAEAVAYVVQACAGIAAAHDRGIIHRDLKPANLFLSQTTDGVQVRVLDFGVSKDRHASTDLTGPEGVLGTTAYMSPEQVRSSREVDARSDVWALGVVLYKAITGTMHVRGTTAEMIGRILDDVPLPRISEPDAPRALANVIARALDKNPNGRPPNARALAHALVPFAERTPMVAKAIEELDRATPSVVVSEHDPALDPDPHEPTLEIVSGPLVYIAPRSPADTLPRGTSVRAAVLFIVAFSAFLGWGGLMALTPMH